MAVSKIIDKEFYIDSIDISMTYTANAETDAEIDISSKLKSGYKAVGVLGFNTRMQKSSARRCFIENNKLFVSATSPVTSSDARFFAIILEQKI